MGVKPMKVLLRNLSSKSSEVIASGNRNDCGRTLSVMQKISSESRSKERDDEDEIKSLLKKQQKYCLKYNHRGRVPGFIQQISVSPMYIICFTEGGLRVWHDMCRTDVVFWDATGGVLDRGHGKKQILYYELSVRNLTKGNTDFASDNNSTNLSEDAFLSRMNSPFTEHFSKVIEKGRLDCRNSHYTGVPTGDDHNSYFCVTFLKEIQRILLPSAPLWSDMLPSSLHKWQVANGQPSSISFPRSIAHSEQRMGVLKQIQLGKRKFHRIDELVEELTKDSRGLEIIFQMQ
ncbi:hypothetical protein BSL78_16824 [Apostichopus japonicus]|uniref:Uncharacterized protein n=1 Tax=Stichopus japonicus TaxID=307972 RepID=A0A2G8KE78_STIJA|nr:hypothetical protein BSL78_16824 [Apostichopus japonicus]